MRFLVVDGLRSTRIFFKEQIESICDNADVVQCMSAEDAIYNVIDLQPDIIISSEILPFRNGFELVRVLNKMECKIPVIVIAEDRTNALQAIKSNVFDYLLMPVDKETLRVSVTKAVEHIDEHLRLKYADKSREEDGKKIRLNTTSGYKLINMEDIAYFISDGSYTKIVFANGESELSSFYLGKIEKVLENLHFLRISRSVIINLKNIHQIDRTKNYCILELETGLHSFNISRSNLKKLEESSNLF